MLVSYQSSPNFPVLLWTLRLAFQCKLSTLEGREGEEEVGRGKKGEEGMSVLCEEKQNCEPRHKQRCAGVFRFMTGQGFEAVRYQVGNFMIPLPIPCFA